MKRPSSVVKFCRRVRKEQGNICENCGATSDERQIESHHILPYSQFPELGKDRQNILVVCVNCHPGHSIYGSEYALAHAYLKPELRKRIADYIREKDPKRWRLAHLIEAGESVAKDYHFSHL